uniref:Pericentrin n=1 Tax=Acanthochromis polyacanthus TaxID=80966 RepID=A0A3Q1FSN0_9TELE
MDEDERRRKLEAGKAKLASYRQKRAKSNGAGATKKTQKRKGQTVTQNDSSPQDPNVEPALPSASATELNRQKDEPPTREQSPSPVEDLKEEELAALTGKEQLQQLQQAVEKRNEIIAKLSSNLQEALASRDQVQLEAQSLAVQIQALQRQLQQVKFLRIKSQSGPEVLNIPRQLSHHGHSSQDANLNQKETPSEGSGDASPGPQSCAEDFSTGSDCETETVLQKLRAELEEEKKNSQRICAELAEEMEKNQRVLSLLEKETQKNEEERKDREAQLQNLQTQLSQVQTQCLELQQYKEEKEKLNREVLELKKRLQDEEDSERKFSEEVASFNLRLQNLEGERLRQEEEMKRLKEAHREEVEQVRQLLDEREKELNIEEPDLESGPDLDNMNTSVPSDILMERYLSSAPTAHSQSSLVNESFEQHSQLDISADLSFELNSEVFGDQPLLSISIRPPEEHDSVQNTSDSQHFMSKMSEQYFEETDLEKELLNQQCGELREELALKDRDLNVLREEVIKSAEELEEARSRWAQVTEELKEALWELEEEKEKRRHVEEEMNLKANEQDNLKNKLSALFEEREKENVEDKVVGELKKEQEKKAALSSHQKQQELLVSSLQEIKQTAVSVKESPKLRDEKLEETKMEHKTTTTLLNERTMELDTVLKELETTRVQILNVQTEVERLQKELRKSQDSFDFAEKEKNELESQISCLRQNLACLEEVQVQSVQEREEHRRKEEEMDERIKKMEQVLEEELEQFENMLKAKDVEVRCMQCNKTRLTFLFIKQELALKEATEKLKASHQQEIKDLMEKHEQEILESNTHLETELLKQQASMEEEQKRQISLIKQVTEREHERMVSALNAKHNEEISQLRTEVTLELRESMEAAHQAELQQAQTVELEALRLSLSTVHLSQLEHSQVNLQQEQESALIKVQASMRETFARESALLQARHQSELNQIEQLNQEQQERLREVHQRDMGECRPECFSVVQTQWEKEAETTRANFQTSLSEIQNNVTATQTELSSTRESLRETNKALTEAQAALSQTLSELQGTQARLEELQTSSKEQTQKLEEELKQARADRDAAACSLEELISSHKRVLQEKEQQALLLEEKEQQLQQEVLRLQEEKTSLRKSSEEEVGQLWTQLESMRTSRQELGELKEQLLARSSRVDDIECLKKEFNEQKREIKEQNEAELENLRRYFEKRLRATEESHKEEIALLQLRLVESALEESVLKTTDDNGVSQGQAEMEKDVLSDTDKLEKQKEMLDTLRLQLEEKHTMDLSDLQSSLTLSFKEELQQVRSDLTDHYYEELQEMKTHHAMDLEQLRAKLSDSHLRGATPLWNRNSMQKVHLYPCLVQRYPIHKNTDLIIQSLKQEREHVQENMKRLREELQEKHETEVTALKSHFDKEMQEKTYVEEALHEEKYKSKSLQAALDNNENPQHVVVRQWLEAPYDSELQKAKSCMSSETKELAVLSQEQVEERLHQAQERFQEEKAALEQHLVQKYEESVAELKNNFEAKLEHERATRLTKHSQEMDTLDAKHKAQLESLGASHRDQLAAMAVELESKHNAELVALEAVLQETSQARLEALEAELSRRHQEERDQLEKRMLGNMDTLEATYLKEVQLEDKHCEDLNCQNSEHKQLMERHNAEQLSIREDMRKELAQVHMEKFRAMAAELSHVHKSELAAQKEALDTEHCKALETLKKQVLTVTCPLHLVFWCCLKGIKETHCLLQELKGVSARELEACRRELEEESSRQRQHFLEEVELLKVQSEERMQDRINQLKFEEQKEAELEDLRRSFTSEQEEKEQSYTGKMSQLTAQLQQLDAVVAQLRAEVECLQGELKGKRAEMETLDTLLQRRERESQEGGNLLKMLTDDLHTAKEEKRNLYNANEKLKKVLIEMLRSITATEELIGQKLSARIETSDPAAHQRSISVADLSSEDLDLTHQLCESLLVSDTQISPGGEEAALNSCSRLRQTVDALLELLNQANSQLEQTHNVHLSLEQKFSQGREDSAQLLEQHKLLLEQLDQEAKMKSQLQLELHKAEGLLEGYVAEKAVLEESLQQKETQEERLVEELEDLKLKLQQIEEHTSVLRQKEHLSAGLGEREKALLGETERLTQDRLDLQRQAEKSHKSLSMRLRTLERELEEQETKGLETELHHKTHTEDLNQRVQALEKQLKHDRQFIEEQAVEREHERDEFQQEIRRLEAQVRQTANVDNKGHRVESLQAIIKDKTEDHASLLAANQQAQRDLAERNEEIDKLTGRIRELEQALLNTAESKGSVSHLEQELHRAKLREQELTQDKQALEQQQLSNRLQISALQSKLDETRHGYHDNVHDPTQELRNALDTAQQTLQSKEQEVCYQLENVQRDLSIKEVELKHLTLQLELLTNKNAEHVNELQDEVEETEEETFTSALLQEKNQEIDHLNSEIQKLEQELENARDNKALEVELEDLHSQVEHLQSEITRVRQDKQEEEERLHEVISTLQAELATLGPNLHEVSDSQDGDSINPSPAPSPEPHHYTIQEEERRGGPNSLRHELNLTHSASSRSLRSRLKALQSQLETAVAEKEGLERLLLTQEEEYRGQGEEFGKRLKAEREKCDELKGFLILKEAELEEVKAQAEEERKNRKLSEDDRDSLKVQDEEVKALLEEKAHLNSLVLELQKNEEERAGRLEALKTKEAEVLDMEELVAEERTKITTLETVKGELSAEREALRKREGQLQEEIERLRQEGTSMRAVIQELTVKLSEKETGQEEAQKEVLTHAEATLAKADAALREKEAELTRLKAEVQALRAELTAVKQGLSTSTERAEKLHEEGQTKDCALIDLETDNQRLKAELRTLQEDLAIQEEELAYQQRELQQLRQQCHQDTLPHHQEYPQKDEASLNSPEVLRRLECSEDRIPERFHNSVLGSRLSELSGLNSTGLDLPQVKLSPRVIMEPPHSRTITPDPATQSTHSPGSLSVSDNFSVLDSLDADKVRELEELDLTTPPSPLGSTSSLSAPEWASDGYGSNVSSELGARLRVELEQTERLDAQFIEYLRCRGMNPTANTDSAAGSMSYSDDLLSPELQGLLKKVYQESCRILTLSQRRATPSIQPHKSLSNPPMNWQQEKRALQETVIALRELLCRMAQRHTHVSLSGFNKTLSAGLKNSCFKSHITGMKLGEDNWQRDQLQIDGRLESQLRAELEESKKQVKCAHDTQQEQKNKILSLRYVAYSESQHLSAVQVSSEQQRSEVMCLKGQVEQEKVACSNLRRELQIEQSRSGLLEKRLEDTQKELEDEHKRSAHQQELSLQEKTRLERLLTEAESRLTEIHSKLADSYRKLDEERDRGSRQVDELGRRHEADAARDRKFISDLRSQLEQERRQGEELAAVTDKLRAELLQSRRKWEDEDRTRREELQREQEAATRHRVAVETLKEQKQEASRALEVERERSRRQGTELTELKERLRLLKDKEREREEQWERERRKGRQEQMERERRHERTNSKLCELELLRQQDQQRMQELQRTLAELEREERQMAAERMSGRMASTSSSTLLETLLKENSELTERVTSLSQERATFKHRLTCLERQLRTTENELAKVTSETENRPINDVTNSSKVQRLYERYLRAESFRKALVYQKRYLLLLIGGFQDCEQATLCLIARMGARPSPPLSSQRRPFGRFRAVVRVVIAVSRMRFLTRKWQKSIRRLSLSGTVNGHAPAEVLRQQQQPRSNPSSPQTRDSHAVHRETMSSLIPPIKSPFRLHNRFELFFHLTFFFKNIFHLANISVIFSGIRFLRHDF